MSGSSNFDVVNVDDYVDIFPDHNVALSGESLARVVKRIETKLRFDGDITAGEGMFSDEPGLEFCLRLHGASAENAERLRDMDLFPVLQPEEVAVPDIRFVHKGRAFVDPKQVLTVEQLVAFGGLLRTRFGDKSGLAFHDDGQFVYHTSSTFGGDAHNKMIDVCKPRYKYTGEFGGENFQGHVRVHVTAPPDALSPNKFGNLAHVLRDPAPVIGSASKWSENVTAWLFIDTGPVETYANVRRLYELSVDIMLALGIYPYDDFVFTHDEHGSTLFMPPPLSSR